MPLRIVGGEFRRRKLRANPGLVTRPITDRMKESLFNLLDDMQGQRVADVFAGTGTLGLEALSRGAQSVVFFERDRKAYELLQSNVDSLGAEDRAFCWRVDIARTSFRPRGEHLEEVVPYSVIFFDPPYKKASDLTGQKPFGAALDRLARETLSTEDAVMILRTPREVPLTLPKTWSESEQLCMSSSRISFCRKC